MPAPRHLRSWLPILLAAVILAACGGGASSGTESAGASQDSSEAAAASEPAADANLCDAVTEELAVAALGGAVGEPQFGDVVPRPNGIYCHYALAADDNVNVEAQLKEMSRVEFEALATTLLMDQPLDGAGEAAFQRATGIVGLPGTSILVFAGGRGVNVTITAEGDATAQLAAAIAIAEAALAT